MSAGRVPPSASGYRQLLGALSGLHVAALQLLQQLLKASGGTLRPLYASLSRLVSDLLRRVAAAGPATFSLTSWLVRVEVSPEIALDSRPRQRWMSPGDHSAREPSL